MHLLSNGRWCVFKKWGWERFFRVGAMQHALSHQLETFSGLATHQIMIWINCASLSQNQPVFWDFPSTFVPCNEKRNHSTHNFFRVLVGWGWSMLHCTNSNKSSRVPKPLIYSIITNLNNLFLLGYQEDFFSDRCVIISSCKNTTLFWVFFVLIALVVCIFFLFLKDITLFLKSIPGNYWNILMVVHHDLFIWWYFCLSST